MGIRYGGIMYPAIVRGVKHHPIKGVNETDTPLTVKKLFTVGRS